MAVKKPDGVLQTTTSTGTGDLTLDGTVAGYRTFAQAVTAGEMAWGDEVYYVVQDGTNREWGRATVISSGPTLKRSTGTMSGSTNGGSAISAAGGGVTQIFPAAPDNLKLLTQDRKANGGTIAETGTDNAFSVKQTLAAGLDVTGASNLTGAVAITDTSTETLLTVTRNQTDAPASDAPLLLLVDKNGGAESGPNLDLDRQSASPAANDVLGYVRFKGFSSTGVARVYAAIKAIATTVTNASEAARVVVQAMVGGTLTDIWTMASNGLYAAGLTPQGAGTGNFTALYVNGVLQTAGSRQAFFTYQSSASQTSVTGAQKITLTSASYNSITSASWDNTNDELTLPAGTYRFQLSITSFEETGYSSGAVASLRFRNTTDSSDVGQAIEIPVVSTDRGGGVVCFGDFTIAGSKVFRAEISYGSGTHTWTVRYPQLEVVKVA